MLEVVSDAIRRLRRDQWWESVHDSLDGLTDGEAASYRSEAARLDVTGARDLNAH
jgi:hypothetical protein